MTRLKDSFTIEEDLSNWLRNESSLLGISTSEFVNRIVNDYKERTSDDYSELFKIDSQISNLEKSRQEKMKKIELLAIEGNKKEREEAEVILQKQKEKEKRQYERLKFCYERIKKLDLLEELDKCNEHHDFLDLARKIMRINAEENRKISDSVGAFELMRLKEQLINLDLGIEVTTNDE